MGTPFGADGTDVQPSSRWVCGAVCGSPCAAASVRKPGVGSAISPFGPCRASQNGAMARTADISSALTLQPPGNSPIHNGDHRARKPAGRGVGTSNGAAMPELSRSSLLLAAFLDCAAKICSARSANPLPLQMAVRPCATTKGSFGRCLAERSMRSRRALTKSCMSSAWASCSAARSRRPSGCFRARRSWRPRSAANFTVRQFFQSSIAAPSSFSIRAACFASSGSVFLRDRSRSAKLHREKASKVLICGIDRARPRRASNHSGLPRVYAESGCLKTEYRRGARPSACRRASS